MTYLPLLLLLQNRQTKTNQPNQQTQVFKKTPEEKIGSIDKNVVGLESLLLPGFFFSFLFLIQPILHP